jgi:hypothetical protein
VFELTGATITASSAAAVVTALGTTAVNANFVAGDLILIATYTTAGDAQIWEYVSQNVDITAGELTLVATLLDVAADALVAADFI